MLLWWTGMACLRGSGSERRRVYMRFMLTFRIPTDEGNAAAKDGRLAQTVQSIMEELRPEAAYFADIEGARGRPRHKVCDIYVYLAWQKKNGPPKHFHPIPTPFAGCREPF
jgi:hypothetical protein